MGLSLVSASSGIHLSADQQRLSDVGTHSRDVGVAFKWLSDLRSSDVRATFGRRQIAFELRSRDSSNVVVKNRTCSMTND